MSSESAAKPLAAMPAPSSRHFPGLVATGLVLLFLAVILAARIFGDELSLVIRWIDAAVINVTTLVMSFFITVTLLIWFLCFSGYTWRTRGNVMLGLAAIVTITLAGFRIDGPSGDLAFGLVPRNWLARVVLPARPEPKPVENPADAVADLETTTPDDFPQFLGPDRTNYLPAREDAPLARDWSATPPKLLWKQSIGEGWCAFSVVNGYAVTLEQHGAEEWATCYEARTGKLVWKRATPGRHSAPMGGIGPRATPTIFQGRVYCIGGTGRLSCLDGRRGTLIWEDDLLTRRGTDLKQDAQLVMWGRSGSPLVVADLGLLVVSGGGPRNSPVSLLAYDLESGKLKWQGGQSQISYVSPTEATLAGRRQIISINEKDVTGHEIETGAVLWQHPWPGSSSGDASCSQPHFLDGDRILLSKGYGVGAEMIRVVDRGGTLEAETVWKNGRALKTKFANVTIIGECAYGLSDGILECVDLADGKSRWKRGRYGHGQILGVGDVLLVLAESGKLALVEANPDKHVELGSIDALDGKTWNSLCLAGKLLLIRNSQEAACYELP